MDSPALLLFPSGTIFAVWPLFSTVEDISWYRVLTYDIKLGPKLNASKHLAKKFQLTESKAFSKSTDSSFSLILFLCVYIMIFYYSNVVSNEPFLDVPSLILVNQLRQEFY